MIEQFINGFHRQFRFTPGYDKRPKSPNDPNYGIHPAHLGFVLISPARDLAVEFGVSTGWFPSSVERDWDNIIWSTKNSSACGWGVDFHYHTRQNEYEELRKCDLIGQCYGGYSYMLAREWFRSLCDDGEDAIWKLLEEFALELQRDIAKELSDMRRFA